MNLENDLRNSILRRRKSSLGQLISTIVFFVMSIWLAYEAIDYYNIGQLTKSIFIFTGSFLALIATFRFQIQSFVNKFTKKK